MIVANDLVPLEFSPVHESNKHSIINNSLIVGLDN